MQTKKIPLKYLYTVTFKDGRVYQQNQEDTSLTEPDKRSCFFDIQADVDKLNIATFVLKGDGHEYGVDLRDGHFEIDGKPFFMHDGHLHYLPTGKAVMMPFQNLKLVFFRNHRHQIRADMATGESRELDHNIIYRMGWEAKASCGHGDERIMQIV